MRRAAAGAAALALLLAAAPAWGAADRGDRLSAAEAERAAAADPKVRERASRDLTRRSEKVAGGKWQVGFFDGSREVVQVVVDERSGRILESWEGDQVAWRMARGYEGAFGRSINAPYLWLPLCALFFLAFFDWRRPLRVAHLDLLALLGFGLSHFFFNRGEIDVSVPLVYPFLLYLLARMLWIGIRGRPADGLRPTVPVKWLAIGAVLILGIRVGLNIADSNVIDVGFAGVIGADQIARGEPIYGAFPDANHAGDTYGPAAYWAYTPFEQALPWSGRWDDLPAAHAAAIFFDLATAFVLFVLGRRLRPGQAGVALGTSLAFAWAAFPYTAFVLETNANDALVALLVTAALLAAERPLVRGAVAAAAALTKFAPLVLLPLLAARYRRGAAAGRRDLGLFATGAAGTAALLMLWPAIDPGLSTFWERTVSFQADRGSPFSIWGQAETPDAALTALRLTVVAFGGALFFTAGRIGLFRTAALGAAAVIAVELTLQHWFYLYIVWFLPLVLVALAWSGPAGSDLVEDLDDGAGKPVSADLDQRPHHPDVAGGRLEAHGP